MQLRHITSVGLKIHHLCGQKKASDGSPIPYIKTINKPQVEGTSSAKLRTLMKHLSLPSFLSGEVGDVPPQDQEKGWEGNLCCCSLLALLVNTAGRVTRQERIGKEEK